jgi:hypothetical protein
LDDPRRGCYRCGLDYLNFDYDRLDNPPRQWERWVGSRLFDYAPRPHPPNVTPTNTPDPLLFGTPTLPPDTIGIGGYVQITGTEGDGLRMRSAAGINAQALFLGYDEEVFVVKDGPQEADGYSWWYLVAPYDATRAGWAASNFLSVVPGP